MRSDPTYIWLFVAIAAATNLIGAARAEDELLTSTDLQLYASSGLRPWLTLFAYAICAAGLATAGFGSRVVICRARAGGAERPGHQWVGSGAPRGHWRNAVVMLASFILAVALQIGGAEFAAAGPGWGDLVVRSACDGDSAARNGGVQYAACSLRSGGTYRDNGDAVALESSWSAVHGTTCGVQLSRASETMWCGGCWMWRRRCRDPVGGVEAAQRRANSVAQGGGGCPRLQMRPLDEAPFPGSGCSSGIGPCLAPRLPRAVESTGSTFFPVIGYAAGPGWGDLAVRGASGGISIVDGSGICQVQRGAAMRDGSWGVMHGGTCGVQLSHASEIMWRGGCWMWMRRCRGPVGDIEAVHRGWGPGARGGATYPRLQMHPLCEAPFSGSGCSWRIGSLATSCLLRAGPGAGATALSDSGDTRFCSGVAEWRIDDGKCGAVSDVGVLDVASDPARCSRAWQPVGVQLRLRDARHGSDFTHTAGDTFNRNDGAEQDAPCRRWSGGGGLVQLRVGYVACGLIQGGSTGDGGGIASTPLPSAWPGTSPGLSGGEPRWARQRRYPRLHDAWQTMPPYGGGLYGGGVLDLVSVAAAACGLRVDVGLLRCGGAHLGALPWPARFIGGTVFGAARFCMDLPYGDQCRGGGSDDCTGDEADSRPPRHDSVPAGTRNGSRDRCHSYNRHDGLDRGTGSCTRKGWTDGRGLPHSFLSSLTPTRPHEDASDDGPPESFGNWEATDGGGRERKAQENWTTRSFSLAGKGEKGRAQMLGGHEDADATRRRCRRRRQPNRRCQRYVAHHRRRRPRPSSPSSPDRDLDVRRTDDFLPPVPPPPPPWLGGGGARGRKGARTGQ